MYFAPLFAILFSYSGILMSIRSSKARQKTLTGAKAAKAKAKARSRLYSQSEEMSETNFNETTNLASTTLPSNTAAVTASTAKSGLKTVLMGKAKRGTLRTTIAIVLAFVTCWTPYAAVFLWDQLDRGSLRNVMPHWLKDVLFIFAVTNSCVNPLVHSRHVFKEALARCKRRCQRQRERPV